MKRVALLRTEDEEVHVGHVIHWTIDLCVGRVPGGISLCEGWTPYIEAYFRGSEVATLDGSQMAIYRREIVASLDDLPHWASDHRDAIAAALSA